MDPITGTPVFLESTASRVRVSSPKLPTFEKFRVDYDCNIIVPERKEKSYPDLCYKPWISVSGLIVVGVGPFYKAIFISSNTDPYQKTNVNPPVWLDANGDIWTLVGNQIVVVRKEDWKDSQPTTYFNPGCATVDREFIVYNNRILTFNVDVDSFLNFVVYPVMYDLDGNVIWEGSVEDSIPYENWYYCWDVKSGTVIVGGYDLSFGSLLGTIQWEKIVAYSDTNGTIKGEYTEDSFNGPRPIRRQGVTKGLSEDGTTEVFWFYYNENKLYAETRDSNLNIKDLGRGAWGTIPIINTNLDYVIGTSVYRAHEYYNKEYTLTQPCCLPSWENPYPLGDSGTCWVSGSTLVDLARGECVQVSGVTFQGKDSGLSWHNIWGGIYEPNVESIYDYVIHPDEIEDLLKS